MYVINDIFFVMNVVASNMEHFHHYIIVVLNG